MEALAAPKGRRRDFGYGKGCGMKDKSLIIKITAIILICSALFFCGAYFVSVGTLVSRESVMEPPISGWFRQQYALFFDDHEVDIEYIEAYNRVKDLLMSRYYK